MALPKDVDDEQQRISLSMAAADINAEVELRLKKLVRRLNSTRLRADQNLSKLRVAAIAQDISQNGEELSQAFLQSLSLDELTKLQASIQRLPDGSDGVAISWKLASDGHVQPINEDVDTEDEILDMEAVLTKLKLIGDAHAGYAEIQSKQHELLNEDFYAILARITSKIERVAE